jgi:hypothetical protein
MQISIPDQMALLVPDGYDPKKIMAYEKPGLGIESFHQQGITERNIGSPSL